MSLLHQLAGRPLAILPSALDGLVAGEFRALAPDQAPAASRFVGERAAGGLARVTSSGTGVVTADGPLINRGAVVGENWGFNTYEGLSFKLGAMARDPKIKRIVLDLNSPGGAAAGAFELAAQVRKINREKPVYASVNSMAASAAYAIASGARAIVAAPSSIVGSIGVVSMHLDLSKALGDAGVTPTLIHAGAHKVDGNPYEPLSKEARGDLQAEINKLYSIFVATVAAGRGARFSADAARKTEARTYLAADAKKIGLVDEVGTFTSLLESLEQRAA